MPITTSAKKALRNSDKKRVFNLRTKKKLDEAVKTVKKLVIAKDKKGAEKALPLAYKAIDKAAKTGFIKKNAASRKTSRISAMIKKIA